MALLEYAVLLLHSRSKRENETEGKIEKQNGERLFDKRSGGEKVTNKEEEEDNDCFKGFVDVIKSNLGYKMVDSIALVAFALAFFAFNIFYWSFYL